MYNILNSIKTNLERKSPIINNAPKQFSHAPSRAMCYSAVDKQPIGACMRAVYLQNKGYPQSNPTTIYVRMTAEAGKLWESWLVNQYKELGIYISHSTKLYDKTNHMSGEFDIVHYNPETDKVELTECKQYNGSNYYAAKSIAGSKDTDPKPKDSHLLQCFDYLIMCTNTENENIDTVNLLYLDRSCGSFSNNMQFTITLTPNGNTVSPKITYLNFEGEEVSYVDERITLEAVLHKNEMLKLCIDQEVIPPRDYVLQYDKNTLQQKVFNKEVSTYKYNQYIKDPTKNPIGDWNCIYCPFGPDLSGFSTCWSMEE